MALAVNIRRNQKTRALHLPKEYAITKQPLPLPKGGIPLKPYPRWLRLPLESKLPVGRLSMDDFTMTIGRLSQKVYRTRPEQEFDLSDPYLKYRPTPEYNALHDPNLRKYFRRPELHRYLHRNGFITSSDRIVCRKLSEFNQYRRYLHRLYVNEIRQYRARQQENWQYRRAIHECRRVEKNWASEEYATVQKRRSRCVDLCRMLADLDEQERKRYHKFLGADIERKAELQRDRFLTRYATETTRIPGIERQLTEFKGIKERIDKQKQKILFEWIQKLNECKFTDEEIRRIKEIERRGKELGHIVQIGVYKDVDLFLTGGRRKIGEPKIRKQAIAQKKKLIDNRRKNSYAEYVRHYAVHRLKRRFTPKKSQSMIGKEDAKSRKEEVEEEEEGWEFVEFDPRAALYQFFEQRESDHVISKEESSREEEREKGTTQQSTISEEKQEEMIEEEYHPSEETNEESSEEESLLQEEIEGQAISTEGKEEETAEEECVMSDRKEEEISLSEKEEEEEKVEKLSLSEEQEEVKLSVSEKQKQEQVLPTEEQGAELSAAQQEKESPLSDEQEGSYQEEVPLLEDQREVSEEGDSVVGEQQGGFTQSEVSAEILDEEVTQEAVSLVQGISEEELLGLETKEVCVLEEDASTTEAQQLFRVEGCPSEIDEEGIADEDYVEKKKGKEVIQEDTIEETQELLQEEEYSFEEYFEEEGGEELSEETKQINECEEGEDLNETQLAAELNKQSSEVAQPLKITDYPEENDTTDLASTPLPEETKVLVKDSAQSSSTAIIETPKELYEITEVHAEETNHNKSTKQTAIVSGRESAMFPETATGSVGDSEMSETPTAAAIELPDAGPIQSQGMGKCSNVELPPAAEVETDRDSDGAVQTGTSTAEGAETSYTETLEGVADETSGEEPCYTADNEEICSSDADSDESSHIKPSEASNKEQSDISEELSGQDYSS